MTIRDKQVPPKNPRGRPYDGREVTVRFKVTEKEKVEILRSAEKAGMKISTWIRMKLLKNAA